MLKKRTLAIIATVATLMSAGVLTAQNDRSFWIVL